MRLGADPLPLRILGNWRTLGNWLRLQLAKPNASMLTPLRVLARSGSRAVSQEVLLTEPLQPISYPGPSRPRGIDRKNRIDRKPRVSGVV